MNTYETILKSLRTSINRAERELKEEAERKQASHRNKKAETRARLNSKSVSEVRNYARSLGIRLLVKGTKKHKTKEVIY